jgi:hypothetical protein
MTRGGFAIFGASMRFRIWFYLIFLLMHYAYAQEIDNSIDHDIVSAYARGIKEEQVKKQKVYDTALKVGAAAVCGYVVYYCYTVCTYNNLTVPLTVPANLVQEFKTSPAVLKKAIEEYATHDNSFFNSNAGGFVKFTGSLVLQSMVFQALQPVYKHIQAYFSSKVSVPITSCWFLAEQYQGVPEEMAVKKVDLSKEFSETIMHIESLEYAYNTHQADLIKDSAQAILSHIIFVKEYETTYIYQKHILQKTYDALTLLVQDMIHDAHATRCDQLTLDNFKNTLRELRKVPTYSII